MFSKSVIFFACTSACLGLASMSSSVAATSTAAIAVSATVNALCQIGSDPSAPQGYEATVRNAQSAVKVRCDLNVPYTVSVDVKTSALTESLPVTTTSNADASLQTAPFPPTNPVSHGISDLRGNEWSVITSGQHPLDRGSDLRTVSSVVVTTVTY